VAVIINDFEIVVEQPAKPSAPVASDEAQTGSGPETPKLTPEHVLSIRRWEDERALRVRAH
jgi:hypothetical protein